MPLRELLTRNVIVASGNYAFLALVDMCFRALQPIFLSTPIALGGLGLDPPAIGTIISLYGILNSLFTVFFFARLVDCYGLKRVYLMGVSASVPCFSLFPVINYLARNSTEGSGRLGAEVWVAVGLQVIMAVLICSCYGMCPAPRNLNYSWISFLRLSVSGAVYIFIAGAAPNKASSGATNGLAQQSVSIVRAVGPALVSSLYSLSIDKDHHYMNGGLVYYVTVGLGLVSIWVGSLLPNRPR